MKYTLQVFSGSWRPEGCDAEAVIRRISETASRLPVSRAIVGWNTDASFYKKLGGFLHGAGIEMLLWLPVFSEINSISAPDGALDIFGKKIAPPARQGEEGFDFVCPSSPRNAGIVKDIYEKYFSGCGFDGVFLDRVRTQSFSVGVSGVLSCGCPRCREAFRKKGVDLDVLAKRREARADAFFNMRSYPADGAFLLEDEEAQRFFEAKEEIIADAVSELCRYFKQKGLTVGLDLFAPLVSRFVGQNYALITREADFIKPMLYRKTNAPAGIAYEYGLVRKFAPGVRLPEIAMDAEFLKTQLQAVKKASCEQYPGIEINYIEGLAEADAAYIRGSLSEVNAQGFKGAVLCWNIMEAPDAHIDAAAGIR